MPNDVNSCDQRDCGALVTRYTISSLYRQIQATSLLEVRRATSIRLVATPLLLDQSCEVPYVPTSMETVKRMLEIANVRPKDVVYDLGCGDGRILLQLRTFHCKKGCWLRDQKRLV